MSRTYLDNARDHWNSASILYRYAIDDEGQLKMIALHIQQSIELALKYTLQKNGVRFHNTHAIEDLILLAKQNDVQTHITEFLEDHAEIITTWKQKCSYVIGFLVEIQKLKKYIEETKIYLTDLINSGL